MGRDWDGCLWVFCAIEHFTVTKIKSSPRFRVLHFTVKLMTRQYWIEILICPQHQFMQEKAKSREVEARIYILQFLAIPCNPLQSRDNFFWQSWLLDTGFKIWGHQYLMRPQKQESKWGLANTAVVMLEALDAAFSLSLWTCLGSGIVLLDPWQLPVDCPCPRCAPFAHLPFPRPPCSWWS